MLSIFAKQRKEDLEVRNSENGPGPLNFISQNVLSKGFRETIPQLCGRVGFLQPFNEYIAWDKITPAMLFPRLTCSERF